MAIRFLADGNIDENLQVQSELIVGNGSTSYSKIANNAITLYDSSGDSKGQIFINESGSSNLLMINNGATGGTVYFGAPTTYVQNVIIQGGTLTIGGISNASSDTDKFLVSDSGEVKYRTGAQVRSDIGAGTGSMSSFSVTNGSTTGTITNGGTLTLSASTGITVGLTGSGGNGTFTITNSAPDQTVALTGGTGITISGTYPNFTITNSSPSSGGTITGSGTSGRLAKFNGSTSLTDSRIFESGSGTFIKNSTSTPLTIQNDGSISIAEFEGSATANESNIQITPGTASKPGLNFGKRSGTGAGDTNTGIFSSAADKMEFSTGGSERVQITSNGTKLTTLNALGSAASVFLTSDSGIIKTRTAAQVRSDIGAGTGSGSVTSVGITAGTGISVSGSPVTSSGSITVTNSAPDQTVALTAGTGISISGTYPNFTITNSSPSSGGTMSNWKLTADSGGTATIDDAETVDIVGGTNITTVRSGNNVTINTSATTNTGTVTSVGITAGTGISVSGSPVTSSGSITVTNSAPDQTVALTGGTGISISGTYPNFTITNSSPSSGGTVTGSGTANFISKWSSGSALTNSEISDTGSVIQLGLDASNNSTLYLDTTNRKVGFRTTSPGAAFDVNGTIRVRNQLNVGHTTEQNLYVNGNGAAGGQYVKMGNYGNSNYFGITSSENQPKYTAAFGPNGKIVEDRRIMTVKISASAINTYHTDAGVEIIPAPGSGNIIWPQSIFIYRGAGSPGTGWPASDTAVGASFYMCDQVNTCSSLNRIANIASGVCKSNTGTWFWGRPVPLPSLNENPNVEWLLDNKNLRFKTAANISNATMDWYVRIEYIQMNITAGFTNNVDATIT